jgi:hypothetical protein
MRKQCSIVNSSFEEKIVLNAEQFLVVVYTMGAYRRKRN